MKINVLKLSRVFCVGFVILLIACVPQEKEASVVKLSMKPTGDIKLSELVDSVTYIQLQNEERIQIGEVDKVVYGDGKYYILDSEIAKSIFVFDDQGRLIRRIGEFGIGPGQFVKPTSFAVNSDGHIYVFDMTYRLLHFDDKGEHLSTSRVYIEVQNMEIYQNHLYFYTGYGDESHGKFNLIITDLTGEIVQKQFPFGTAVHLETGRSFQMWDNQICFYQSYDKHIYKYDPELDSFIPEFELLTLGEMLSLTDSTLDLEQLYGTEIQKYSMLLGLFCENENYLHLLIYDALQTSTLWLNKASGAYRVGGLTNDIEWVSFNPFTFKDDHQLVGVILADEIHGTQAYMHEHPERTFDMSAKVKELYSKVNIGDNPVLAVYHLKH